ncbi:MAG TPA: TonB-dependent receptor [Candidatus Sulfotelmatobacter sp.]|nr:TonB-dependent receptor [Candidatus Sulfotelmatobacter sp.]
MQSLGFRLFIACFILNLCASASVVSSVRGVIHDPQHRPVQDAMVMIKAKNSEWAATANSDSDGNFAFNAVPLGEYTVTVARVGFEQSAQDVMVVPNSSPVLHFALNVAGAKETVNVSSTAEEVPTDTATPTTVVSRLDVARTPGAARTNSLAMITNFVPGSYITHDQLHIRGGHQTSWLVDGVPIPNTNIASNVGPQFDPKDIDYLEVGRGAYGAEFGDRTYGVFNVVPRNGFERNREAELLLSAGNSYQTNDAFSLGSHTERLAYYVSVNGNRSNLGLQAPVPEVVHDASNGYGGFGSLIFNLDPSDQLRFNTSMRKDFYQVPYDPFANDIENGDIPENGFQAQYPSLGLRDAVHESDALVNFSWVHTFDPRLLLTVSPFYHYNAARYESQPDDVPVAASQDRSSNYAGGQVSFSAHVSKNDFQAGLYTFYQSNHESFGAIFNDGSGSPPFADSEQPDGNLVAFFVEDKFKPFSWMTLSAGMRPTHFSGNNGFSESAISPRFSAALTVPRLNWTFRGFYGQYYQAPPLVTASGPLIDFCNGSDCGFIPLPGERDEEHLFGVTIPFRGWVVDADTFHTRASNFFDHDVIGESNLFFPLTIEKAVINGWEVTLRSPRLARRAQLHLAYSNQIIRGGGAITGGLTDFDTLDFEPLDHDQRNTLNIGGDVSLPWRSYASANVYYGSGFTNGFPDQPYPGDYLPAHTTFDLTLGKEFGERFSASVTALNVANRRVLLDNSETFGGFHWNNPREIFMELRYRFHF